MARKLALGSALIATWWCVQAFALGLGDITVHSALNEKLNADIELLETRGMSEGEIVAKLGTADDFKRVGIERFFFLTSLQFQVQIKGERATLHVTSEQPITEPYLNFLVQVVWPNGRLLKEYTLLLDPPTYKEQAAPAVASPGRSDPGGGPAGRVERTPTRPDSQVSLSSAPRSTQPTQTPPADRLTGDSYGMTDRDDTLWKIAQRSRPSDQVSVQQNMLAIQRLNPQAFIGNNINLLKAGYKLRLPTEADVAAISSADAVSEVAAQNRAWEAYRRGEALASVSPASGSSTAESQALAGQVDATATAPNVPANNGPDGELHIVAGDANEQGTGTGAAAPDAASLEGELAAAKEEAERIARERDDAVAKLGQLTSQVEQSQRQIEVRDQQIAQMQQQLKTAKGDAPSAAAKPADQAAGSWLASPWMLGGAAILIVLIVVAGLMRSRSRRQADDSLSAFDEPPPLRTPIAVPATRSRNRVEDVAEDEDAVDEPVEPADASEEEEPPHHEPQTSDVIGEADIYIAYGRYPQAVSLLLGALEEDPNRSDVRLKLLEVYAETKDEQGFESHMNELLTRCDDEDLLLEARELESKLRDGQPISDGSITPTEVAETNLDDFQLDLDTQDESSEAQTRVQAFDEDDGVAADDLGGDLGIDFKTDDEPTVVRAQAASSTRLKPDLGDVAVAGEEDEFDLEDLEFEQNVRSESSSRSRAAGEDEPEADDAFEFLNEEDAATTKLDLARAYIDMGDEDGAREILGEVLQEGSNEQQKTANELLSKLG